MWTSSLKQISLSQQTIDFVFLEKQLNQCFFPPMVKPPWYNTLKIQLVYAEATQSYFYALVPVSLPPLPWTFHCLMKKNIYFLCAVSSFSLLESQRKKFVFFWFIISVGNITFIKDAHPTSATPKKIPANLVHLSTKL